jgi:ABC-2 type transport system ATP-binding protein
MIKINNLTVAFDANLVLNDINTTFDVGKVHGIVGLNGAGKSTFFNTLSGQFKPNTGTIIFNETTLLSKHISFLETNNFFYSRITGNEYLNLFVQTNLEFNLAALQTYFSLPLNELIEGYSTGMRKKLALLAILKQDNPILILDEPFNGLDMETNKVVELIIIKLQQKQKTIFISSHIIAPLLHVCDYIHYLHQGTIVKSYPKTSFDTIENDLFAQLQLDAQMVINNAI